MSTATPESLQSEQTQTLVDIEFYKRLVSGNRDGLWHRCLETGELWVTERWCSMLGYAYEERPRHIDAFKDMVHPNDLEDLIHALKDHLEGRKHEYWCKYRIKDKVGNWREVLSRGLMVADASGRRFLTGSHADATEIFEKVKGLDDLHLIYDSVFHSIPHLIVVKGPDDRFLYVNKALAEFWGEDDHKKMVGKKDEDYNPNKEEVAAFLRADAHVRNNRETLLVPKERNTDIKGKQRWLTTIKVPLPNPADNQVYVVVVATFIDKLMEAEQIASLARNVSHKLGTRIFTLRNLIGTISASPDDQEELTAAFDDITLFADDFLKLTSADRIKPCQMNLLNIVHRAMRAFAGHAKVTLNHKPLTSQAGSYGRFGYKADYEMVGDESKLFDVFAELGKNSLKWTNKCPHRITVTLQVLNMPSIARNPSTSRLQVIIEDNGPGIASEFKESIFEPFTTGSTTEREYESRADFEAQMDTFSEADTKRGTGTGLGLAIADEVIKSHGGNILENGTPGHGARFVITLPRTPPKR